jgi:TPR repeat protein
MYDVFISHSSKDKLTADAICHSAESRGIKCWIAPRDVTGGKDYGEEITSGIRNSSIILLIFSKDSNASHAVRGEVELAFRFEKTIVPYRIENAEISDGLNYYLAGKHWLDAYPDDIVFSELVGTLEKLLGKSHTLNTKLVEDSPVHVLGTNAEEGMASLLAQLPTVVNSSFLLSSIDLIGNQNSSNVLDVGEELIFPLYCMSDARNKIVTAGGYSGEGRFAVISHSGNLRKDKDNDQSDSVITLLTTLLSWLGETTKHKTIGCLVGYEEHLTVNSISPELRAWGARSGIGFKDVSITNLEAIDVLIVGDIWLDLKPSEIENLLAFIKDGGSVLFAALGWSWATYGKKQHPESDGIFPINRLGERLGFWVNEDILGERFDLDGQIVYSSELSLLRDEKQIEKENSEIASLVKAALLGDATAQWKLGLKYENGTEITKDLQQSFRWFKQSALRGSAIGQHRLALAYAAAWGVKKNAELAIKWWMESAEKNCSYAQGSLARRYEIGDGVEKNPAAALLLYEKSATGTNPWSQAQFRLGELYYDGIYVEQDYLKAAEWFARAAVQNTPYDGGSEAQYRLGMMLKEGKGIKQDFVKAAEWFKKASVLGNKEASFELELMELITPEASGSDYLS